MPFPNCSPTQVDMQRYLANLSIRCLLNRIHHCLYFTDEAPTYPAPSPTMVYSDTPMPQPPSKSFSKVCSELDSQLQCWFDMLPDAIRPCLESQATGDLHGCLLRLRYWSAKQLIYRPFLIYATSMAIGTDLSEDVYRNCQACLSSCRAYLYASVEFLSTALPSPYAYLATQWLVTTMDLSFVGRRDGSRAVLSNLLTLHTV